MAKTPSRLLEQFLGEMVVIFIKGMDTEVADENQSAVVPLAVEGILYDYDDRYLLIGNEEKTAFSLLNQDMVGKLDAVDESVELYNDPKRPGRSEMN